MLSAFPRASRPGLPLALFAASVGLLLALPGCARNLDPSGAAAMWQRLDAGDGYRAWAPAPDYDQPQPTVGAHGDTALVYLNDVAIAATNSEESLDAWPDGAILVKDSFDSDGELYRIAAMEKREGAWIWVEWDEKGEVLYSGSPETCTGCHGGGDDFTLVIDLP